MGRKTKTDDAGSETAAPKEKKGKSNLIPAVVIAVGLIGGGYFFGGSGGKSKAAATAGREATTSTTVAGKDGKAEKADKAKEDSGEIAKLDSITLNLADGHFVKLGLALQLKEGVKLEGFESQSARALDYAISTLGDLTYAQLAAPGGRNSAKDALDKKVVAAYGGKVTGIYFTEFIMQ